MSALVKVELGGRSYGITVGRNLPIGTAIVPGTVGKALIVSDSNVDPLYGEECERKLRERGLETFREVVPAGEASKSRDRLFSIYARAVEARLDRSSAIVALGGGMVGDLAGFAAATFLRGIRLIQAPTSLLAMVDSSVGGKTGINLPQGKNLVGAFHQPIEVAADMDTLATLPDREFVSGLAEVVKYGIIRDAALFENIEKNAQKLLRRDMAALEETIAACCRIKAEVVSADEHEGGPRAILNFGHTLGHALEQSGDYGRWLHGEAVSLGMVYAAMLSTGGAGLSEKDRRRITALLAALRLPVKIGGERPAWDSLARAMSVDKKSRGGVPAFVLAERIGSVVRGRELANEAMKKAYMESICLA